MKVSGEWMIGILRNEELGDLYSLPSSATNVIQMALRWAGNVDKEKCKEVEVILMKEDVRKRTELQ
jgi:hypothetical protein